MPQQQALLRGPVSRVARFRFLGEGSGFVSGLLHCFLLDDRVGGSIGGSVGGSDGGIISSLYNCNCSSRVLCGFFG